MVLCTLWSESHWAEQDLLPSKRTYRIGLQGYNPVRPKAISCTWDRPWGFQFRGMHLTLLSPTILTAGAGKYSFPFRPLEVICNTSLLDPSYFTWVFSWSQWCREKFRSHFKADLPNLHFLQQHANQSTANAVLQPRKSRDAYKNMHIQGQSIHKGAYKWRKNTKKHWIGRNCFAKKYVH